LWLCGCGSVATPEATRDAGAIDAAAVIDVGVVGADVPAATDRRAPEDQRALAVDAARASDGGAAPALGHASMIPSTLRPSDAARLIVMGDSISAGTGASRRPGLAYGGLLGANDATRWPEAARLDLAARFGHAVPVVNVAVGGATTGSMRADQPGMLRTRLTLPVRGHSVVVITIGGNDLQLAIISGNPEGGTLTSALANIRQTVQFLQDPANFPDGVSIYLSAVYDPSDGEGYIEGCFFNLRLPTFVTGLDTWRARYFDLGRELGVGVIDALGHFHGHGHNYSHMDNPYFDRADTSGWFRDCIHPNDRGHHELRRLFFEAIDGAYRVTP
jgi:lysophospholipase L1-like esterase